MFSSPRSVIFVFLIVLAILPFALTPSCTIDGSSERAKKGATETKKIKAGFLYSGPIGDRGWSRSHEAGRRRIEAILPWLETVVIENVPPGEAAKAIEKLVTAEGCDVVFATSMSYSESIEKARRAYPGKIFMLCSGVRQANNLGTYFIEVYQIYYLNGLMAGALTNSGRLGYIGSFPVPEVVRHINAFAIGVMEVNPDAIVDVRWLKSWFDPEGARCAVRNLVKSGCDVVAFTEDSDAVVKDCQNYCSQGRRICTFSHYSPMQRFGPDAVVSGQQVIWAPLYREILTRIHAGEWTPRNYLWKVSEGAAQLGGRTGEPVNAAYVELLKGITIDAPGYGNVSVYDLVMKRLDQMRNDVPLFDPFTGPIRDREGRLRAAAGERLSWDTLLSLDWFAGNVEGSIDPVPGG